MSWTSQRWELVWAAIKDIILTGTGVAVIISQMWSRTPSDVLLVTGLALTAPSVASHAKVLLTSQNSGSAPQPSPYTPPSGSSSSGSSREGTDGQP